MDLKLTKLPWYAPVGIAFGIALVIAMPGLALPIPGLTGKVGGLFYYLYEGGKQDEIARKQTQLKGLQAENAAGRATEKKLPEFRAEVADLEAQLNVLKEVLPEEKDAAALLDGLYSVAVQSNITIKSFKPSPTVTKQLHSEWPIALELEGTYHNLATFFDRVGKLKRIINITGLDVKQHPQPETNLSIAAICTATTFVLLDKPVPPPAPAGRGRAGA